MKAATFGVTLGVVLQGTKRLRFGAREITADPTRLLVVTRDTEHASEIVGATRQRPYLASGVRVGEVAIEVGFASPAHFTREFKRRFGVSPSRSLATLA